LYEFKSLSVNGKFVSLLVKSVNLLKQLLTKLSVVFELLQ